MDQPLSFSHLKLCIEKMEIALSLWEKNPQTHSDKILKEIYRDALIKEFELTVEVVGKLLQKTLLLYCVKRNDVKRMTYKDIIRQAGEAGLINNVEAWFLHRDGRNVTAHEYGIENAEALLENLQTFIHDARNLYETLEKKHGNHPN